MRMRGPETTRATTRVTPNHENANPRPLPFLGQAVPSRQQLRAPRATRSRNTNSSSSTIFCDLCTGKARSGILRVLGSYSSWTWPCRQVTRSTDSPETASCNPNLFRNRRRQTQSLMPRSHWRNTSWMETFLTFLVLVLGPYTHNFLLNSKSMHPPSLRKAEVQVWFLVATP